MRYFLTTDAARAYNLGGHSFSFEPMSLRGGSWLGILAVDEPAASVLADHKPASVDEISFDYYDGLKKKGSANSVESPAWPKQERQNPVLVVAERAGVLTEQITAKSATPNPNSTENVTAVTLLTTKLSPPPEPYLEGSDRKKKYT